MQQLLTLLRRILSLSDTQTVVEKQTPVAQFVCSVESNPFSEDTVQWDLPDRRGGFPAWSSKREVKVDLVKKTSTLLLHFVDRHDAGRVVCSADNGVKGLVGREASRETRLVVHRKYKCKYKYNCSSSDEFWKATNYSVLLKFLSPTLADPPIIDKSPQHSKFAVPRGSPAYLSCRTVCVPPASFSWHTTSELRGDRPIDPNDPSHGESMLAARKVAPDTLDSVLKLDNVRTEHYSTLFHCMANNSYGSDTHTISVVPPGRPDPPAEVRVVATAATSVRLAWRPGFNGGHNQTFVITVLNQKTGEKILQSEATDAGKGSNVGVINATTLEGLRPHTSYIIRLRAKNKAGLSETPEEVFVKTRCTYTLRF